MQHRGDHLPPKAGALEHVQAARQVLGTLQPRQRGASRQFGELARRQTQRPEIRLDEPGAGPKWKLSGEPAAASRARQTSTGA